MPNLSPDIVGTPYYDDLIAEEAMYWDRANAAEVDISVATWRDAALGEAASGDLLQRTLDEVVAHGPYVLDLGCADGALSMRLARRGCCCDGIDIAPGLITIGRRTIAELQHAEGWTGDVRLMVGDLNQLDLATHAQTYDVVLAMATLHHVLDLEHLLDQMSMVLKPGGSLICLDHMQSSLVGWLLRYVFLLLLPTEIPYHRKPVHLLNRLMARVYRDVLPNHVAPAAFTLPLRSPFEDISGAEILPLIRERFVVDIYETHLAFADVVAGHLRLGSPERNVRATRLLRALDDWLVRHLGVRGETYFLVAHKPTDLGDLAMPTDSRSRPSGWESRQVRPEANRAYDNGPAPQVQRPASRGRRPTRPTRNNDRSPHRQHLVVRMRIIATCRALWRDKTEWQSLLV